MKTYKTKLTSTPILYTDVGNITWNRKNDKTYCRFFPEYDNNIYYGVAVRKHSDQFDFIFGMKQSLGNMFKNSKLPKEVRKRVWDIFRNTYGDGICEPQPYSEYTIATPIAPLTVRVYT